MQTHILDHDSTQCGTKSCGVGPGMKMKLAYPGMHYISCEGVGLQKLGVVLCSAF